jgi:hypothetical protein
LLKINKLRRLQYLIAKNFIKKIAKIFGGLKKVPYFCRWRDGRVVECGGLENR